MSILAPDIQARLRRRQMFAVVFLAFFIWFVGGQALFNHLRAQLFHESQARAAQRDQVQATIDTFDSLAAEDAALVERIRLVMPRADAAFSAKLRNNPLADRWWYLREHQGIDAQDFSAQRSRLHVTEFDHATLAYAEAWLARENEAHLQRDQLLQAIRRALPD